MYEGIIEHNKPTVLKSGYLFSQSESLQYLKLYPMFSWGKSKGAEQLSFAILFEEYGFDFAEANYKDFCVRVIEKFDAGSNFKLSLKEIEFWRKNSK